MKPKNKRGQCGKNALPKRGLTDGEKTRVEKHIANNKQRWEYLFSLNKWTKTI